MARMHGGAEEVLYGGVANAGAVVRAGGFVLRPAGPNTALHHRLLRHVRSRGFLGVPEPVGIDPDGRERLVYVEGEVPRPPFPAWSQSDGVLASVARLLAGFHAATRGFDPGGDAGWSSELADPRGPAGDGTGTVCHNDVCLENVVFRDGEAVALLDFDTLAPGRPVFDLAQMARMCVPLVAPVDAAVWGWRAQDPFHRLRLVADAYGLPPGRDQLVTALEESVAVAEAFVQRRVARGEAAFVAMWETGGGQGRVDRRREWFRVNRDRLVQSLG